MLPYPATSMSSRRDRCDGGADKAVDAEALILAGADASLKDAEQRTALAEPACFAELCGHVRALCGKTQQSALAFKGFY